MAAPGHRQNQNKAEEERANRGTKIHHHQLYNPPAGTSLETAGVVPGMANSENKGKPCIYCCFSHFVRGTTDYNLPFPRNRHAGFALVKSEILAKRHKCRAVSVRGHRSRSPRKNISQQVAQIQRIGQEPEGFQNSVIAWIARGISP